MAYQIEKPAESDFEAGKKLTVAGALAVLLSAGTLIAVPFARDAAMSIPWSYVQATAAVTLSLGIAIALWGLRVYATQAEYDSALRNNGLTPPYEGACTMLSLLFVIVPICGLLMAYGIIELPTFPKPGAQ